MFDVHSKFLNTIIYCTNKLHFVQKEVKHILSFYKMKASKRIVFEKLIISCKQHCIAGNQMSLALNIMTAVKDFSRKWMVVKIYHFTGHFTLHIHTECYK